MRQDRGRSWEKLNFQSKNNRSDHGRRTGNSYVARARRVKYTKENEVISLEYQIGQVVYSKSGHDKGDVQMIVGMEGDFLLLADGRRRKLEKPKRTKKMHVQPTLSVEAEVAAKLQQGAYVLDADIKKALKKYREVRNV